MRGGCVAREEGGQADREDGFEGSDSHVNESLSAMHGLRCKENRFEVLASLVRVLNVGGGPRTTEMPQHYRGWEQVWLDVDGSLAPDILLDARRLTEIPGGNFDGVYCSHNLEHYYKHDVPKVLAGFQHCLSENGIAEIIVPDIGFVVQYVVEHRLDIEDVLYQSAVGTISVRDVIYGYAPEIEKSGQDFYAHKTGFTPKSLERALRSAGFSEVIVRSGEYFEVHAFASRSKARMPETDAWQRFYP
jgi:hypothetical protein